MEDWWDELENEMLECLERTGTTTPYELGKRLGLPEAATEYRPDLTEIWCPCHNGHYDLHGKNIQGPPPRPLPPYSVNVENDRIAVTKGA